MYNHIPFLLVHCQLSSHHGYQYTVAITHMAVISVAIIISCLSIRCGYYYTGAIIHMAAISVAIITLWLLFIWLLLVWLLLYRDYYYTVTITHVAIMLWPLLLWLLWHGRNTYASDRLRFRNPRVPVCTDNRRRQTAETILSCLTFTFLHSLDGE